MCIHTPDEIPGVSYPSVQPRRHSLIPPREIYYTAIFRLGTSSNHQSNQVTHLPTPLTDSTHKQPISYPNSTSVEFPSHPLFPPVLIRNSHLGSMNNWLTVPVLCPGTIRNGTLFPPAPAPAPPLPSSSLKPCCKSYSLRISWLAHNSPRPLGMHRTALTAPLPAGKRSVLLGSLNPLCRLYSSTQLFLLPT